MKNSNRLVEVALVFLKLGTIGFGGPPALIALMENEMVQKRQWVSREYFMDMLGAINMVPGPNAVEMAIYLGYAYAGLPALVLAGIFFLLPATLITLFIAFLYVQWGTLPEVQQIFYGITPVIIAIIFISAFRLGKSALKNFQTSLIAIACLIAAISGVNGIYLIFIAGLMGFSIYLLTINRNNKLLLFTPSIQLFQVLLMQINDRLIQLGLYFLKIGAIIFGSGFVLFAYIHYDVVNGFHWLTEKQLVDAIAVGQITPGPVSSSATFIGYLVEGLPGAAVSTIMFFLPSFIIILILGRILPKLRKSLIAKSILDGVNAAVVALIISVGINLFRSSIIDLLSIFLFIFSLIILLKYKIDPIWLILSGAIVGIFRIIIG